MRTHGRRLRHKLGDDAGSPKYILSGGPCKEGFLCDDVRLLYLDKPIMFSKTPLTKET